MPLTRKLLLSFLAVVVVASGTLVFAADRGLRRRLMAETTVELEREAWGFAAAAATRSGPALDSLTRALASRTGRRLTIISHGGVVIADSDVPPNLLASVENHATRLEVRAALAGRVGIDLRHSATSGRWELKVAVPLGAGVARVSSPLPQVDAVVDSAQGAVLLGAIAALLVGAVLAWGFSHRVARPLVELRNAAQAMARGERLTLDVRGRDEVGDLARALNGLDENLTARIGQLERERAEMAALIASMVEGVLACNAEGAITSVNPAARRLLGLTPDAGAPTVHELFRSRAAHEAVAATLAGDTTSDVEIELDHAVVLLTGRALPGGGAVFVLHDVTTLQRLEAVRRDFAANVSHELKTPLTAVRGYAETLASDDLSPDVRARFLGTIIAHARRMQRLIDDLLDLSRIESRAWQPEPDAVDVAALAHDVWSTVGAAALGRGVAFAATAQPEAAQVRADPEALRQILTNLLENAARFTPAGGRIEVTAAAAPDAIVVEVADTGSGIPSEHLARVFERFYRVDPHRSREQGGTGLGLSIVKHLVEAHGGRVEAESRLGQGTTIRITLPTPPGS